MDTNKKFIMDINELKNSEFILDELFTLEINHNNVKYEFLIRLASQNKNLICFGSGAYDPNKMSPPIYNRYSWQNEFEESLIYYNDATLYNSHKFPLKYNKPNLTLGWGIGKHDEWYLLTIADIIRILSFNNDIKSENILFFGSSGGGFTSIILSTIIKDSVAIVNNPQIFCRGLKDYFENIMNACFDNLDPEIISRQYEHRFDIVEMFEREKYMPNLTYLVNVNSEIDMIDQFIPFMKRLKSINHFDDQINILLYSNEDGHNGVFDKEKSISMIKNHFKTDAFEIDCQRLINMKYENKIKSLEKDSKIMKTQLDLITNTNSYKFAYFLNKISQELLKGNKNDKKNFLKGIYNKLTKRKYEQNF